MHERQTTSGWLLWSVVLVLALIGVQLASLPLRYLVNDDYQMLYTAWLRAHGALPVRDFGIQSFHLLPELIAPIFRIAGDTDVAVLAARVAMVGVLAAAAFSAWRLASRLTTTTIAAFAPVALLSCATTWTRGVDIRPDLIVSTLLLSAFVLVVDSRAAHRRVAVAVVLAVVAIALRIKGAVAAPGLLVLWGIECRRAGLSLRAVVLHGVVAALAGAGTAGVVVGFVVAADLWPAFVEGQRILLALSTAGDNHGGLRGTNLALLWRVDGWFVVLAAIGALRGIVDRHWRPVVTTTTLTAVLLVAGNAAFYSYNLPSVCLWLTPAVVAGVATVVDVVARRVAPRTVALIVAVAPVAPVLAHVDVALDLVTRATNERQRALAQLLTTTPATTVVFALEGLGLFRPSLPDWRLSAISVPLYRRGDIPLGAELRRIRPEIVVETYRTMQWLAPDDRAFIDDITLDTGVGVRVLGVRGDAAAPRVLEVPRPAPYSVFGSCLVDGASVHDTTVSLAPGPHRVDGACVVAFALSPAALEVFATSRGPLLASPDDVVHPVE